MDLLADVGDKWEAVTQLSFVIQGGKIYGLIQTLENKLDIFSSLEFWLTLLKYLIWQDKKAAYSEEGNLYSSGVVNRMVRA